MRGACLGGRLVTSIATVRTSSTSRRRGGGAYRVAGLVDLAVRGVFRSRKGEGEEVDPGSHQLRVVAALRSQRRVACFRFPGEAVISRRLASLARGRLCRLPPATGTHHRASLTAHPGRAWAVGLLSAHGVP